MPTTIHSRPLYAYKSSLATFESIIEDDDNSGRNPNRHFNYRPNKLMSTKKSGHEFRKLRKEKEKNDRVLSIRQPRYRKKKTSEAHSSENVVNAERILINQLMEQMLVRLEGLKTTVDQQQLTMILLVRVWNS
ncbi:hypothetical protein QTP88_006516 [Uroleucon formosanum]